MILDQQETNNQLVIIDQLKIILNQLKKILVQLMTFLSRVLCDL